MGRFARQFGEFYRAVSGDVFKFCEAVKFKPTWQQEQLLAAVQRGDPRIACKSGQGPGKTTVSAVIGIWRAFSAYGALTIVTAPTMRQCTEVWLSEARRIMARADPWLRRFIEVTNSRVKIGGMKDWGVKLVTATREENAQGYHEPNMTIICEEASGIPKEIITQFKGTLSNPNSLMVQIGNPNTRDCEFFNCFHRDRHEWTTMTFNAEETPESEWFSHDRNRQLEREFGRDSDVYRVRVLGEFPHADPNCVISSEDLEKVCDKGLMLRCARLPRLGGSEAARQFGLDFARYGGDENTLFRRSGNAIVEWMKAPHTDPSQMVDAAFAMQRRAGWRDDQTWYVPDATGMGQGVMHRFYEAGKRVLEFHNHGKSVEQDYDNKITEAWFHLARLAREQECCLPEDNVLIQQLAGRRYYTTRKGKLILETKDEYMKRGNESPDRADGLVMSFYDQVKAAGRIAARGSSTKRAGVIR